MDHGHIYLSSSGYYNISSTGNTSSYIYDNTTSSWVTGYYSGYQNYLYLYASHNYDAYVYGYTTGQSYTVTVS